MLWAGAAPVKGSRERTAGSPNKNQTETAKCTTEAQSTQRNFGTAVLCASVVHLAVSVWFLFGLPAVLSRDPLTGAAPAHNMIRQSKPWSFAAYCSHVKQVLKRETPGGPAGPFLFLPTP